MDHNLVLLKASKHRHTQEFIDYNLEEDLLPTITRPTRIHRNSATLLDNMFISRKLQCTFESGIIISDHVPTLLCLKNAKHEIKQQRTITYRKITEENIKLMNDELNLYNWTELLKDMNTDASFNVLHNVVIKTFNHYIPEKEKRPGNKIKKDEQWITPGIKNSIVKQKKLYKMTLHNTNPVKLEKYQNYRKLLQQLKRKAKIQYYRS